LRVKAVRHLLFARKRILLGIRKIALESLLDLCKLIGR
jgi:hypothetical protein